MTQSPRQAGAGPGVSTHRAPHSAVHPTVRLDYVVRLATLPIAMLVLYSVFREQGRATPGIVALLAAHGLVLPHLYYFVTVRNRNTKTAEHRNLTIDGFFMGAWAAAMHFSLWPTLMLVSGPYTGSLSVGGWKVAGRAVIATALGALGLGWVLGFPLRLTAGPLPTAASIGGILIYMTVFSYHSHVQSRRTVHSRKQLERRARQVERTTEELEQAKEEAEAANRSKSAFLANMSHELRTPLNAVIGLSEIMIEDAGFDGNEHLVPDLEKIKGAGEHLLELINEVLDLSKIEAGKIDLYIEEFDAGSLVSTVVGTVGPAAERNGNRLIVEAEGLGLMRSDPVKVRQILLNLLSNACKFTEAGEVRLRAERRTVDGRDRLVFEVADSGIGMTPEQQARIFQPFTQADSSTTRKYGGTGLGLVISARFAAMLGGDIGMESEFGSGTTFTLTLPARVDAPARAPQPAVAAS